MAIEDFLVCLQRVRATLAEQFVGLTLPQWRNNINLTPIQAMWVACAMRQAMVPALNFSELRDCVGDFNDCHYYFPDLNYTLLGDSIINVSGSHYRAVPGWYKLPFCEGFYVIYPMDELDGSVHLWVT